MLQLVQRKIKTNMYTHIDHQEYRHIEINFKIDIKLINSHRVIIKCLFSRQSYLLFYGQESFEFCQYSTTYPVV